MVHHILNRLDEVHQPYTGHNSSRSIKYDLIRWKDEHKNYNEYSCFTVRDKEDVKKIEKMIEEQEQEQEDYNQYLNIAEEQMVKFVRQ